MYFTVSLRPVFVVCIKYSPQKLWRSSQYAQYALPPQIFVFLDENSNKFPRSVNKHYQSILDQS